MGGVLSRQDLVLAYGERVAALDDLLSSADPGAAAALAANLPAHAIRPRLLLGSTLALTPHFFAEHGVTHVLNCLTQRSVLPGAHETLTLSLEDAPSQRLPLLRICAFMHRALQGAGALLVHCQWGVSRSAACVLAYLVLREGLTVEAALRSARAVRGHVAPNPGFLHQLVGWERECLAGAVRITPLGLQGEPRAPALEGGGAAASPVDAAAPATAAPPPLREGLLLSLLAVPACCSALLSLATTEDAVSLRLGCRALCAAVAAHAWRDSETLILGSVAAWRACFPRALAANVSETLGRQAPLVDADFVHFEGLWELDVRGCTEITDAAFSRLRGIRALKMGGCDQEGITDAAFLHLAGIQSLDMHGCRQATITDAAFAPLRGIQRLNMSWCNQPTITDAAFPPLAGIQELLMEHCSQRTISDAAFAHLRGVKVLVMHRCNQPTITDAAFAQLEGVQELDMGGCDQATLSPSLLTHLRGCRDLQVWGCAPAIVAAARAAGLTKD